MYILLWFALGLLGSVLVYFGHYLGGNPWRPLQFGCPTRIGALGLIGVMLIGPVGMVFGAFWCVIGGLIRLYYTPSWRDWWNTPVCPQKEDDDDFIF